MTQYLEEHPQKAKKIVLKTINAKLAREAAQKARLLIRRKSVLDSARMPGKLADCSSNDPKECEIFIVEGNSAGGSAKQGRDRAYQAILPLRGKVLNVEKARMDKILQNNEIISIIKALGVGIQNTSEINGSEKENGENRGTEESEESVRRRFRWKAYRNASAYIFLQTLASFNRWGISLFSCATTI